MTKTNSQRNLSIKPRLKWFLVVRILRILCLLKVVKKSQHWTNSFKRLTTVSVICISLLKQREDWVLSIEYKVLGDFSERVCAEEWRNSEGVSANQTDEQTGKQQGRPELHQHHLQPSVRNQVLFSNAGTQTSRNRGSSTSSSTNTPHNKTYSKSAKYRYYSLNQDLLVSALDGYSATIFAYG